jgi:hypothetical protein
MTMATGIRPAMNPVDRVLSRLDDPRPTGPERWRCACPAHGGTNRSTLSIGAGHDGAVLLRCWAGCDVDQIVHALGLELVDLFPPKPGTGHGAPPCTRRRLITAAQALDLLHDEALVVTVAVANIGAGQQLTDADRARVMQAGARIGFLRDEVMA